MRHLDDGTLRRLYDEPLIVTDTQRRHLDRCERCRGRQAELADIARSTQALLAGSSPSVDVHAALRRTRTQIASEPARSWQGRPAAWLDLHRRRATQAVAGAVTAAALIGAVVLTPAGSLAQTVITLFQPTQVVAVPVTAAELRTLPNLRRFGTVHAPSQPQSVTEANASAASQASGMTVLVPSSVPSSVPAGPTYEMVPGTTGTFTFSAAKAQRWAATHHKSLPAMPANINGSTLRVTTGTAVAATYGQTQGIPSLIVGQMRAPKVEATGGVTATDLENYVLSLPGVSPQLAASIRALGNPTSILPIPVPVNMAHSDNVTVQGVSGLAVGDSTGVGSAVIWEKDGIIYGVGGTLSQSQVIDVANSLH